MTKTINIKPEIEVELARQAEVQGMDVPVCTASLSEQAAKPAQPDVDRAFPGFQN